jgi:hypothetical protein
MSCFPRKPRSNENIAHLECPEQSLQNLFDKFTILHIYIWYVIEFDKTCTSSRTLSGKKKSMGPVILFTIFGICLVPPFNPLRTGVYFFHQNENAKNIGNLFTLLKSHNIGTHLKGIETTFQVVPLFLKSFHFRASYITFWNFLKIPSVFKGLNFFRTKEKNKNWIYCYTIFKAHLNGC